MSCSRWKELTEAGSELLREGSSVRRRAERHFATCAECAEKSYLLDSSWAVRRLSAPEFPQSEIDQLATRATEAMRLRTIDDRMDQPATTVRRVAIIAALLVVTLFTGARLFVPQNAAEPELPAGTAAQFLSGPAENQARSMSVGTGGLEPTEARVYELRQREFALVMVVHETLDL